MLRVSARYRVDPSPGASVTLRPRVLRSGSARYTSRSCPVGGKHCPISRVGGGSSQSGIWKGRPSGNIPRQFRRLNWPLERLS